MKEEQRKGGRAIWREEEDREGVLVTVGRRESGRALWGPSMLSRRVARLCGKTRAPSPRVSCLSAQSNRPQASWSGARLAT